MAKKIYVGNLSFQTTETDLSDMFAEIGQVESVQIITDRDTGRSKGFAFVQMADETAAEKAPAQSIERKSPDVRILLTKHGRWRKSDFGNCRGGGSGRRLY